MPVTVGGPGLWGTGVVVGAYADDGDMCVCLRRADWRICSHLVIRLPSFDMIYENTIEYIPKDEGLFFISGIDEAKWPSEGNLRSDLGSFDQPVTQRVPSQPDHVQRVSPPFPPRR